MAEHLTIEEMTEALRCSMINVGRLLPQGMSISFYRGSDDGAGPETRMNVLWPDGTATEVRVKGCTPIHIVPAVQAIAGVEAEG